MNPSLPVALFRSLLVVTVFGLLLLPDHLRAGDPVPDKSADLLPPPQDQGLPYTRSASPAALAKIGPCDVALFSGSRYAYVKGIRVRLDQQEVLHGGEARLIDGDLFVPASFAPVLDVKDPGAIADQAPGEVKERYVHTVALPPSSGAAKPDRQIDGKDYVNFSKLAREKGLAVTSDPRGLVLVGGSPVTFGKGEEHLLDAVITLFDTPDRFADPAIAASVVPTLARQGVWTNHVTVVPSDLAVYAGPATEWPTVPVASYDTNGIDVSLFGSKVPAPGVYPRLLFSPEDLPAIRERVGKSVVASKALIQQEELLKASWWDPSTSDGEIFRKLATGETNGLEWNCPSGAPVDRIPHQFKGEKLGIYNSHAAYVPECLTAMALHCLIKGDEEHGRQTAAAFVNYYRLREPVIDRWNALSDSEFGASPYNGAGAVTCWRGMHGVCAHMNLGLGLDMAGKWMTPQEKEDMRRIIVKATYGRRPYGQDSSVRFRDVNWVAWDLPHYLALSAIEGLPGADPEGLQSDRETVRAFCDWGIDENGVIYESNGKTGGSLQFQLLSMVTLARRGENLFGHPHWRKFLQGQVQMTSPSGKVTVNSGTQYAPYSRHELSLPIVDQLKSFYPGERFADYLLSQSVLKSSRDEAAYHNWLPQTEPFDPASYGKGVRNLKQLRMPSLSYPGFVPDVLFNSDYRVTSREDLGLPLDFSDPVHGVFSSYSDRTTNAAWMNLLVRPDHYYGAGHHHADAGMFHFSSGGVDWFTQSPFTQIFDGRYFNLVQVDGHAEAETGPVGISTYTAWNAAATWLGSASGPGGATASADMTYSYSWRWLTQPPGEWPADSKAFGWEPERNPSIQRIFAGTARNKMRPWWLTYNTSNYIPTCRAPFNPMQEVFRTAGLVRGEHPYGFVLDDLKKDGKEHLYQWVGMLSGGVWEATVPGIPKGAIVLSYQSGEDRDQPPVHSGPRKPAAGEPLLLVCPLEPSVALKDQPLTTVERAPGPVGKKGEAQFFDRLLISSRGTEGHFRVLLIPFRMGEALPKITHVAGSDTAILEWKGQKDLLKFRSAPKSPSSLAVTRDGKNVL